MTTAEKHLEKLDKARQAYIASLVHNMSDMSFEELAKVREAIFDITHDRRRLEMYLNRSTGMRRN